MVRKARAAWRGTGKDGNGDLSTDSGVLSSAPYSFKTRFENERGTNPEELIAAAHAGCFAMALSGELGGAGAKPDQLEATAEVTLENVAGKGWTITTSHLVLKAKIPGIDAAKFTELANKAKANCPISKLLNTTITLDAQLV
jgi:lipoyl-dependent peroxiredoxin